MESLTSCREHGIRRVFCCLQAEAGGQALAQERKAVRQAALEAAEIVACTLSSAGGELLSLSRGRRGFQALVMDEVDFNYFAHKLAAVQVLPIRLRVEST